MYKELFRIVAELNHQTPTMDSLLGLNMALGALNLKVMGNLDKSHETLFGVRTPAEVPRSPVEGKCILVSGHDMVCLKSLLDQTEGTGINIYTHGEMLPAFGMPELKKYKHLVANFGGAWYQ